MHDEAKTRIIDHALKHAAFDGWSEELLADSAEQAGYDRSMHFRAFPLGVQDALRFLSVRTDQSMLKGLEHYNLPIMKIRERITTAIMQRLTHITPHREAMKRALAWYALPLNMHEGLRTLYTTVDTIWWGIGDHSTDFNFYTKRLTLAAVYSSTVLVWLTDETEDLSITRAFLMRRIDNVMQFEKFKTRARGVMAGFPKI